MVAVMADDEDISGDQMPLLALRHDQVSWRAVGDEVVVLQVETGKYLTLNPSASVVWQRLADGATERELVAALAVAFDVDPRQARDDVAQLLEDLRQRSVLTEGPAVPNSS